MPRNTTTFLISVLISLAGVGASAAFFWYVSAQVRAVGTELERIEAEIASREEERTSARNSEELRERRSEDISRLETFFVDRERPVAFIEALEDLSRKTGNAISLGADEKSSRSGWIAFRLIVEGTPDKTLGYLKLLELMPYRIEIDDLAFRRDANAQLILALQIKTN